MLVIGVGIAFVDRVGPIGTLGDITLCLGIGGDNAVLAPGLDGHVADREATVHRKRPEGAARELHRLIESAVNTDLADDIEDDVLSAHPRPQSPLDIESQSRRYFQPGLPCRPGGGQICRAHPGRKGAQAPISAGVRVGPDNQIARQYQAEFRQEGVLDAHPPDLEIVGQLVLVGELPDHLGLFRRLDVTVRSKVVGDDDHFLAVEDRVDPDLIEFQYRPRRGNIVGQRQIYFDADEVARRDALLPRVRGDDLFRYCHSHWLPSYSCLTA